ncbi:MAG: HAMP domain-containing histidine kinase [Candidatus Melainabacteria bacterium]|nr:HAMP domain-containing histidine kinase [Candidatus Melainabacteria bacterium]
MQDFLELSQASISQQISDIPMETSLKGVNDERLPVEVSAHSVNVNKKNCWIILVNDIRDRIEVRRIRQNFVAIVSHDLRTPLTAIMSHLDLMASGVYGEINEKGLERLSTACRSVERLLSLVNDLLDLEKLESGGIEVECQKIAIEDVVLDTVSSLHELSSSKSITVKYQPVDTYVFADRSRLGQILQNLLSNAIKFSPSGSKVLISEEICGDFVKIKIDDSGPGIPENKRFVVFEKFQQLEKSVRRLGHGSGLGLTIAKELVEKHGGNIGVTDSVLGGCCFWFTLRRQAPPSLPV